MTFISLDDFVRRARLMKAFSADLPCRIRELGSTAGRLSGIAAGWREQKMNR